MLKNQPPNRHGRRAVQIVEQPFSDADQEPPATPIPNAPAANRRGRRAVQIVEQPFNDADQEPPATPTPSPHHNSLPVTPSVSTLDQLDDPPSPASSMSFRPALLPVISGADTVWRWTIFWKQPYCFWSRGRYISVYYIIMCVPVFNFLCYSLPCVSMDQCHINFILE